MKGRKGVSLEDYNSFTVQANSSSTTNTTSQKLKPEITNNSTLASKNVSTEAPHSAASATPSSVKSIEQGTKTIAKEELTKATTTTLSTTTSTTKRPIKKPTITYSADDSDAIRQSEKNINYNVGNEKSTENNPAPKLEQVGRKLKLII